MYRHERHKILNTKPSTQFYLLSVQSKTSEERLKLQVDDMKRKIVMEQERAALLIPALLLFLVSCLLYQQSSYFQDKVSDDLDSMVAELYSSCVDSRPNNLSTIEKLACVEYQMSLLLDEIESIPEDTLKKLRLREEKQRLEMEKKKEMKERCSRRSLSEAKKIVSYLKNRYIQHFVPVCEFV
uniref:Uncharacterized protein n=1 Tax=Stegastes partitus TaxID=144197 RepID=A0A3B5AYS1_9TELE